MTKQKQQKKHGNKVVRDINIKDTLCKNGTKILILEESMNKKNLGKLFGWIEILGKQNFKYIIKKFN
jgi:hypothetical protein